MLTTFQKAVLATIAGSALVLAFAVLAVRSPVLAATGGAGSGLLASQVTSSGGIAPGVVTTGEGRIFVTPDIAILSVGGTVQAATAGEAQAKVAEIIKKVLDAAKAAGIADNDVETSSYNIQPNYVYADGRAPTISGYQAQQLVTLTLRDVTKAGSTLDALVRDTGATNATVAFSLDDPKEAQAEARKLAVENARAKAQSMASAAGISLGRVLSLGDQSVGLPFKGAERALQVADGAATQIPVGDLEIAVQVQMQFEIP